MTGEIKNLFALRLKKRQIKEAVVYRVNITPVRRMSHAASVCNTNSAININNYFLPIIYYVAFIIYLAY
jgi:hypothetical protein